MKLRDRGRETETETKTGDKDRETHKDPRTMSHSSLHWELAEQASRLRSEPRGHGVRLSLAMTRQNVLYSPTSLQPREWPTRNTGPGSSC